MHADPDQLPARWAGLLSLNPLATGLSPAERRLRTRALALLFYVLCAPLVMWYEYYRAFPAYFDPAPPAPSAPPTGEAVAPAPNVPRGKVFADILVRMGDQMLIAWLPNDVLWPSVLLDNPQNFQLGQLEGDALRHESLA
ncbi:hypothetical protein DFAR_3800043 [Desulfarculales bacterium]